MKIGVRAETAPRLGSSEDGSGADPVDRVGVVRPRVPFGVGRFGVVVGRVEQLGGLGFFFGGGGEFGAGGGAEVVGFGA